MPALRGLSVSCLNVDDEGLAALPRFPALRELMPMDVPDAGYRHIGRCQELESLILMYCRDTTDAATEHLPGLSKLASYFNSYTTITDRTPEILSTMDSLERITFDTCHGLTDSGVARLARLPRLRELRVSGRGVTAAVRQAFPATVAVHRDPASPIEHQEGAMWIGGPARLAPRSNVSVRTKAIGQRQIHDLLGDQLSVAGDKRMVIFL